MASQKECIEFANQCGLITGIFTLWDRVLRARPIAYMHIKGPKGNVVRYIRVKNADSADVLVTGTLVTGIRCWPAKFYVAKDHSSDAIYDATEGKAPIAVLAPAEEHDFPLIKRSPSVLPIKMPFMMFWISWRRSSSPLLPQFPRLIPLPQKDDDRLEQNARRWP